VVEKFEDHHLHHRDATGRGDDRHDDSIDIDSDDS
jgi:hypothetical protein